MTREQAKAALPIIQAFAAGKIIQFCEDRVGKWNDCTDLVYAHWLDYPHLFRIKPEPRDFWLVPTTGNLNYVVHTVNPSFFTAIHVREVEP
jgi:hypothetical protein